MEQRPKSPVRPRRTVRQALARFLQSRFVWGVVCGVVAVGSARLAINRTSIADLMISPLLLTDTVGSADAIVVLGAGVVGDCVPNANGVRRVLLGARLWRQSLAPRVVFAGGSGNGSCPVAVAMAKMAKEIGVPPPNILVEERSRNTHENAELSAALLKEKGLRRVLLVTDRLHMRRGAGAFVRVGLEVRRASVPIYEGHQDNVEMLSAGLREFVALAYYRIRGWVA